jgi:PAS domain S-box-containing protein
MNGRWFEYTGLTEDETYRELRTAVHPDDHAHYKARWKHSIETLQSYEVQYRFRRSDGTYRWHLGRGVAVHNLQGKVVKWFGTCTDIHAQKEMEERILNALPMPAAAVDAGNHILYANQDFWKLFFPMANQIDHAKNAFDVFLVEAEKNLPSQGWSDLKKLMTKQEYFIHEIISENGKTLSFEFSPISEGSEGFLLLVRDITIEKREEAMKAEFMSLASHQLRTPLTSIRWSLGRLQKSLGDSLSAEELRLLTKTRDSAVTMTKTIYKMLAIARLEAGLHPVTLVPIALRHFLLERFDQCNEECRIKEFACSVECPADIVLISDPVILREIVENLLRNALRYTPKGGNITLSARRNEQKIEIEVRDTGIGIPRHQQKKVFTKFFRGDNALKIDTLGTGLGLYLVYRLVEVLGGSISFSSQQDRGTTFIVKL